MTSQPLAGLVAVVTGGAGHLGSAMTTTMAEQGARVAVADLDVDRAREHAGRLAAAGFDSLAVRVDVASEESVGQAVDQVVDRFGGLDVLVNNAAPSRLIATDAQVLDVPLATWDALQDVIVRGALLCARRCLPHLVARGGGSIINVASIHAHAGDPDLSAYPVAKAALLGLTRVLATQYGRAGVRCNAVTLGTIPYPSMSEQARRNKLRHQLVPRVGLPADAANLVAFLASPAASFLTGADVVADGGVLAHLPSYADGGTFGLVRGT
ncbi:SDR family NAD(P)-dependent oxidoreductase [Pseudofrankia inefficax]|uniref:Short-chain dehydrogenase/reductase SDR n=1 Tax=Pseudofrankia inefficax (strain DSM 45817 / CECT 9037 / DDB 130130 / EuI1c) TaxID=298654 RepID=E3J7T0_PSEI1|nr:SDR family oxidoreductase [Pseudofrankia inefficax]ADP80834.1 short-chain dehydrogenase/reductase SDR [Pseudofrankia inefficax]